MSGEAHEWKAAAKAQADATEDQAVKMTNGKRSFQALRESPKKRKKTTGDDSSTEESNQDNDACETNELWTEELHRFFVEAVFKVGVRQASPSVILENMTNEGNLPLTTERVKSRLQKNIRILQVAMGQLHFSFRSLALSPSLNKSRSKPPKYRNNSRKSNSEFSQEYDAFLTKALTVGSAGVGYLEPGTVLDMMGVNKLLGGDMAALLSYACMAEDAKRNAHASVQHGNQQKASAASAASQPQHELPSARTGHIDSLTPQELWKGSQEFNKYFAGSEIKLPTMTEEEKNSPLGASMNHVASLFYSMTHQIMLGRSKRDRKTVEEELKTSYARESEQKRSEAAQGTQSDQNLNSDALKPAAKPQINAAVAAVGTSYSLPPPTKMSNNALHPTVADSDTDAMPPPHNPRHGQRRRAS